MATSGSYNFTANRDEIIDTALRNAAGLGDYETATTTQVTKAAFLLNSIIKAYHTLGMPVWTNTKIEIACPLFDSEGKVSIGLGETVDQPKPLKITQVLLDMDDVTRELYLTDRQTFNNYASSGTQGTPNAVYFHPKRSTGELFVYPKPDTYTQLNGTIQVWHHRTLEDVDASSDEIDFPIEWVLLLTYELSVALAPGYGLPIAERQLLIKERDKLLEAAKNFDVEEGSIFMQP